MILYCRSDDFKALCKDVAGKADTIRFQVKGGSMFPFIRSSEWVEIALPGSSKFYINKGDVILFSNDDVLYAHRVIKLDDNGVITRGDQSFGSDGFIVKKDILGKIVAVERNGNMVDITTGIHRPISIFIANSGFILQYIQLFLRKIFRGCMSIVYCAQGLSLYRKIVSKFLKDTAVIREAVPEDSEGLRDLFVMGGQDIKSDILNIKNEGYWLVAEMKNKLVAGLTITRYETDHSLWVIFGLEVKPFLRGLGIGERLVQTAIFKAKEGGATRIGLFVNKRAKPALKLYQKLGFTPTDSFPSDFNKSPDELYLHYRSAH
jgi:ribosomal protein S18 acetylase RimI-like enzyme